MGNISEQNVYPGEDKNKTKWWKYKVTLKAIIPGADAPLDVSPYLSDMNMHYEYDDAVFPYVSSMLVLPKSERIKIQEAGDDVRFTMSIDKFDPEDAERPFHVNYYDDVLFKAVDPERAHLEPGHTQTPEEGQEIADNIPQHPLALYLFKAEHLDVNKKMVHGTYSETTMSDVLLKLVQDNFSSSEMKFHIGAVDNTKLHEQVIVPPMPFIQAVSYLQKYYGLFNNGVNVFFDMKDAWITDPQKAIEGPDPAKSVTAATLEIYSPNEKNLVGPAQTHSTMLDTESNRYLVRAAVPVRVNVQRTGMKEIVGEAVRFISNTIDQNEAENCVDLTFGTPTNSDRGPKERVYWNPTSNPMLESEFKARVSNTFNTTQMTLPQADLEVWGINRIFDVENKQENPAPGTELDGKWKCKKVVFSLNPKGTPGMCTATATVDMRKIRYTA
jgi:hypothetical protein